jgi:ABC-2 type transport system ATP-binding protein
MKDDGVTLVLATHELTEAEALCNHVALMDRGRVTATGSVGEVLSLVSPKELPPRQEDGGA